MQRVPEAQFERPAPPKPQGHEHNFVHLETRYMYKPRSFGNPSYERIERFYCNKCCEEKTVKKYECSCRTPEWFDKKNYETVYE